MGWINELLEKGADAAKAAGASDEQINYVTCKVPFELDIEWPIEKPAGFQWVPWECQSADCYETRFAPCQDWKFRQWSIPAITVAMDEDGLETIPWQNDENYITGYHWVNTKTKEEYWTVAPSESGWNYPTDPDFTTDAFHAKYGSMYTLVKPPADAPISGDLGDWDKGLPEGVEPGKFIEDKGMSGGGFYLPKPSGAVGPKSDIARTTSKAGMGLVAGLIVAGLLIGTAVYVGGKKKTKKRGKKRKKARRR